MVLSISLSMSYFFVLPVLNFVILIDHTEPGPVLDWYHLFNTIRVSMMRILYFFDISMVLVFDSKFVSKPFGSMYHVVIFIPS